MQITFVIFCVSKKTFKTFAVFVQLFLLASNENPITSFK